MSDSRSSPETETANEYVPTPSLETRVRAITRIPLIKIAAECHRRKWQFDQDEEAPLTPAAEARRLVRLAFGTLHRIGDMANKAAEELRSTPKDQGAGHAPRQEGLIHPDVLMNVVQAKLNDYIELHNRGDLTESGDHAWLALVNLQRDMEFALSKSSTDRPYHPGEGVSEPITERSQWPAKGDRMKFLGKNGYDFELEAALKIFTVGNSYEVHDCNVEACSHSVQFVGVKGHFNGVMFKRVAVTSPAREGK